MYLVYQVMLWVLRVQAMLEVGIDCYLYRTVRKYFSDALVFEQRTKHVKEKNLPSKEESMCKGPEMALLANVRNSQEANMAG